MRSWKGRWLGLLWKRLQIGCDGTQKVASSTALGRQTRRTFDRRILVWHRVLRELLCLQKSETVWRGCRLYGQRLRNVGCGRREEYETNCGRVQTVCSRSWSRQVASGAIAGEEGHGHVSASWGQLASSSAVLYFLSFVENVLGATGKRTLGVVELGQDKGTDKTKVFVVLQLWDTDDATYKFYIYAYLHRLFTC